MDRHLEQLRVARAPNETVVEGEADGCPNKVLGLGQELRGSVQMPQ